MNAGSFRNSGAVWGSTPSNSSFTPSVAKQRPMARNHSKCNPVRLLP